MMKRNNSLAIAVCLCCIAPAAYSDSYLGNMGDYIEPPATVEADVMVLDFKPEIRELVDRVQSNLQQNKDWLREYTTTLQPGQAIPYHQNFGVSESEYKLLIEEGNELSLISAGKTQLKFEIREDDVVSISGLPGEPPFDTVIYEAVSDSILSSYGTLSKSVTTTGRLGTSDESAWTGRLWKLERKEVDNQVNIGFVIGKMNKGTKSVLIHEVTGRVDNEPVEYHYMLIWDRPVP